jgi:hypothetical protein
MLPNELSKYALSMMKINVSNVSKPKIYNLKNSISSTLIGGLGNVGGVLVSGKGIGSGSVNATVINNSGRVVIESVKVPFPVLIDRFNIIAKSDNSLIDSKVLRIW